MKKTIVILALAALCGIGANVLAQGQTSGTAATQTCTAAAQTGTAATQTGTVAAQTVTATAQTGTAAAQSSDNAKPVPLSSGIKIAHGPYLQDPTDTEITVEWFSDKPSVGWVEIAAEDGLHFYGTERKRIYDTAVGVKRIDRRHVVRITGLEPGVPYRYRVFAKEVLQHIGNKVTYGLTCGTEVYGKESPVLKTIAPEAKAVRFNVFNDIHGNNELLRKLCAAGEVRKSDFVVLNGDMISIFDKEEKPFGGFLDTAVEEFASSVPIYYTRGNHETRGAYACKIQDYFAPTRDNLYYIQRVGPVCMIVLDTGEDKPDSDIEYYDINDFDGYRRQQAAWLEQAVKSPEFASAPFKLIIAHIPPVGGWHGEEEVGRLFMPILEGSGADIMFCGHTHKHIHMDATATRPFPILVNGNDSVICVEATDEAFSVKVVDGEGKVVDKFSL